MNHKFPGGITAASNDSTGDEFLAGMIRQRDLEDGPTEADFLRKQVRYYEASERQAMLLISALVQKAGGSVEIDDIDRMMAYDLIVYRDESKMSTVLKVRPKNP